MASATRRSSNLVRRWATPVVIGSFLVMGATGVLMFFELQSGLMKEIHQWAGLVLVAGGMAHLWRNWMAVTDYLRRPGPAMVAGLGAVALGVSLLGYVGGASGGPEEGMGAIVAHLDGAKVQTIADLAQEPVADIVARLQAAGYTVQGPDQTIGGVAGSDIGDQIQAVGAALAPGV